MADASVSAPPEPGPAGPPAHEPDGGARRYARRLFWPGGLSSRLLILTVLFAALAVLLILPLSLAQYEDRWLSDRVRAAELASLAADAAPNQVISDKMAAQLLNGAGVVSVAVQSEGVRRLLLAAPRLANGEAGARGVFHFAGEGVTTWRGLAEVTLAMSGGPRPAIDALTTADYPTPARRPRNSALDCGKIERVFGVRPRSWRDGLAEALERLSEPAAETGL